MTLILKSPDFAHQGEIPKIFTCDGNDSSPALSWSGLPQNTKSLVLIVDDPDAPDPAKPKMTWVHWLLYNIPPTATELPQAVAVANLPVGTYQGKNDWKRTGYGGPCPPLVGIATFINFMRWMLSCPICIIPIRPSLKKRWQGMLLGRRN